MNPEDHNYNQTFAPVREQKKAEGHSVRAVYLYTAMADLAAGFFPRLRVLQGRQHQPGQRRGGGHQGRRPQRIVCPGMRQHRAHGDEAAGGECRMVPLEREFRRPVAYDVDYVHRGVKYRSRLPQDPGNRVQVRVSVTPVVSADDP